MRHERPEKTPHYHFSTDTIIAKLKGNEIGPNKKKMMRVI